MIRKTLGAIVLAGAAWHACAQNLIPNPSFEDCYAQPDAECRLDKVKGGWYNPVGRDDGYPYASPDYKSTKGSNQAQLPKSYHGYTYPQDGNAVVGIIPRAGWITDYREYVAVKLISPLTAGKTYRCTFFITNGETHYYCNGAIDKLGVNFSMMKLRQSGYEPIRATPQYEYDDILWDTRWRKISFTFTADKAYEYMTVGCFHSDSEIRYKRMTDDKSNSMSSEGAYYFLDNFSLVEASSEEPIAQAEPPKKESGADRLSALRSQLGGAAYEAEQKRKEEEARLAEQKRKEEEARIAEQKRKEEEARLAEQKRKEEQTRLMEQKRKEEEALMALQKQKIAEAKRLEEERIRKEAEAARLAEQKRREEVETLAKQQQKKEEDPHFHLEKVEKTRYIPNRIEERRVEKQNTAVVSSKTIVLQVYDARAEDGDTVSLSWNGEWIMKRQMVKNKPVEFTITLEPDANNTLIFFAHNLGHIPPNTAVVAYMEGGKKKVIEVESDLKRCGAVEFKQKE